MVIMMKKEISTYMKFTLKNKNKKIILKKGSKIKAETGYFTMKMHFLKLKRFMQSKYSGFRNVIKNKVHSSLQLPSP